MKKTTHEATVVLKTGVRYRTDYNADVTWKPSDFTDAVIHKIIVKRFLQSPLIIFLSGGNIDHVIFPKPN